MATRGKRIHLVTLDNPTYVTAPDGSFTETWTPLDPPTMWAAIDSAPSRDEQVVPGTVTATRPYVVTMDYHPHVSEHTRITFGTQHFSVVGIDNVAARDVELVLTCVERRP